MDAIKGNINSILNGFKQFTIPVYQRTYSWERKQCQRLWDDIVDMQKEKRTGHFVGAIVNIAEQAMPTGVQKFMIIDGQQRMTTLTLLLLAVRDYGYDNPNDSSINPKGLNGMSIQNDYGIGEEKYKMLLTQTDKDVLIRLVERSPMDGIKSSRVLDNYEFFVEMLSKSELTPAEVIEGVAKLQIVNITLDRTVDDAQLIFESLNSTGMDLSQSDLIRNYILMGLEPNEQRNIYNNYWLLIEQKFDYKKQTYLMDRFFRDYLTYKTGKIPNVNKVYEEFKQYYNNNGKILISDLCRDLLANATYYNNILNATTGDKELDKIFENICDLKMEVSYPFLLKAYNDYKNEVIDKAIFTTILKTCETYVFRRAICGIPTNSLNKTFRLAISSIDENNYLDSTKAFFILQDTYKVFPIDEAFIDALKLKDIYNMRTRNYILSKLENYLNKAPINIENYTIEHIMPQNNNLSVEWKEALGVDWQEDQKTYLNTIGNLTLTAYNSEMSDSAFDIKLNMKGGFKESALRINSFVVKQTTWNKNLIQSRANELCNLSGEIWAYPELDEATLSQYIPKDKDVKEFSLEDFEHLNGKVLELFVLLDKRILNISSSVKREIKKLYIAYKADTNFVDIVPQKSRLRLSINMKFPDIIDPTGICVDVTNKGRWGNGDIEVRFNKASQIHDVMKIIEQSYNKQTE